MFNMFVHATNGIFPSALLKFADAEKAVSCWVKVTSSKIKVFYQP